MVKHIVMWKFKDNAEGATKEENLKKAKERLESLQGKIEGLLKIDVGIDLIGENQPYDAVLYSEFVDKESLDAYQINPLHKEVASFIGLVRENRFCVDYYI
jgi:hypothetical protein